MSDEFVTVSICTFHRKTPLNLQGMVPWLLISAQKVFNISLKSFRLPRTDSTTLWTEVSDHLQHFKLKFTVRWTELTCFEFPRYHTLGLIKSSIFLYIFSILISIWKFNRLDGLSRVKLIKDKNSNCDIFYSQNVWSVVSHWIQVRLVFNCLGQAFKSTWQSVRACVDKSIFTSDNL